MSTKCSIAHGIGFHLYNDSFDDEHVFLQLHHSNFTVTPDSLVVKIPLHVWEYLRGFPGADFSDVTVSDEQILKEAIKAVDSRLTQVAEARSDRVSALVELGGALVMGEISLPREEQIANYVAYHKRQRTQKQEVMARVDALKDLQR